MGRSVAPRSLRWFWSVRWGLVGSASCLAAIRAVIAPRPVEARGAEEALQLEPAVLRRAVPAVLRAVVARVLRQLAAVAPRLAAALDLRQAVAAARAALPRAAPPERAEPQEPRGQVAPGREALQASEVPAGRRLEPAVEAGRPMAEARRPMRAKAIPRAMQGAARPTRRRRSTAEP